MPQDVNELEALINERLKSELQRVQDERDQLYERISDCMELRNNMAMLQDEQHRSSLKTMVDLGCDFYVQARMCARAPTTAPRIPGGSHKSRCRRLPPIVSALAGPVGGP